MNSCQNCGFPRPPFGDFCGKCGQAYPLTTSPLGQAQPRFFGTQSVAAGKRLAALVLEALLFWVTFGVGWVVWSVIVSFRSQTPAKQILGLVITDGIAGQKAEPWRILIRQLVNIAMMVGCVATPTYLYELRRAIPEAQIWPYTTSLLFLALVALDVAFLFTRKRRRLLDIIFRTSVAQGTDSIYS